MHRKEKHKQQVKFKNYTHTHTLRTNKEGKHLRIKTLQNLCKKNTKHNQEQKLQISPTNQVEDKAMQNNNKKK